MENELTALAEALGYTLKSKNLKITTAESCTGGWIAQTITEIAGSSAWFERGFVTYSNDSKIEMLGVNPQTLADYGAVSEEVAIQMASGALVNSQADMAIAVTGIAGPSGGSIEKPVGTVYIAWQSKNGKGRVGKFHFIGNRYQIRKQTVTKGLSGALELLN